MRALGFVDEWTQKVMSCVSMVRYGVLLNGMEIGAIMLTKGLRQGDPLSPYLFILCVEGLTIMIKEAEYRKQLHEIHICHQASKISHLFFVDDSFLFLRATEIEAKNLKAILQTYEEVSGQVINLQKSFITFSCNV
ncbi:hypothetical protein SLA2020_121310 [Shorea laevis]